MRTKHIHQAQLNPPLPALVSPQGAKPYGDVPRAWKHSLFILFLGYHFDVLSVCSQRRSAGALRFQKLRVLAGKCLHISTRLVVLYTEYVCA